MARMLQYDDAKVTIKARSKDGRSLSPGQEAWIRLKRNKTAVVGMVMIIILIIVAIFAPWIAPYDYAKQDYNALKQPPSAEHWFGTDNMGRDLFSRCIYGTRISFPIAVACSLASLLLGGSLGFIAGYCGGKTDQIIMRIMDVFQAIPSTLMAIAIIAVLGNGIGKMVLAIAISTMPMMARMCRGALFTVKGADYIESTRALGANDSRLLIRHMIPNAVGTIIIFLIGTMGGSIMIISMLSYIGLGITPPTPEWGSILNAGKEFLKSSSYMVLFPGLMIMFTSFAFTLFGDGLRDALDPRLK